jgi:CSLREA domain-containing protein
MRSINPRSALLPLLLMAACREGQPPTGPSATADPVSFHTPAHKVVNSLADPGDGACTIANCTLREAINDPTSRRITFAPGVRGTITLSPGSRGGRLTITRNLTIAAGGERITIQRRSTDPEFRILRIATGARVTLTNVTIRGAKPTGPVGAILNDGHLTLTNCTIEGNGTAGINSVGELTLDRTLVWNNAGAGIVTKTSPVTISNSSVSGNAGVGLSGGGTITVESSGINSNSSGIAVSSGILKLTNTEVIGSAGSGLSLTRSTATLDYTTILANGAPAGASGIGMFNSELTMDHSWVAVNGVGIRNQIGKVTVSNSAIAYNWGDGIRNESHGRAGVSARLVNSTVSGNFGEGVFSEDDVEATATVDIESSTIVLNGSYGIHQSGSNGASVDLSNSIVAQNGAPGSPDILSSGSQSLIGAGFSLIGNGAGSGIVNGDGNLVGNVSPHTSPIDPRLGPLADNGGPTQTHALLAGSPARDAGGADFCPATDQRGVTRPQGSACDMGSYERE